MTDWEEWLAGTDPNDGNSFFFAVQESGATAGEMDIEWPSLPQRFYTVYEATDLDGDWSPAAVYIGTGAPLSHSYDPAETDTKFFKVGISLDAPPNF